MKPPLDAVGVRCDGSGGQGFGVGIDLGPASETERACDIKVCGGVTPLLILLLLFPIFAYRLLPRSDVIYRLTLDGGAGLFRTKNEKGSLDKTRSGHFDALSPMA